MKNGFLFIDKEKGINSFKLVLALRKKFEQKEVGFAGTLDPLASGLMIFALGNYTKLLPYLEKADKVYEVVVEFGKTSTTFDLEGEISQVDLTDLVKPDLNDLKELLKQKFTGEISQVPPQYSAIKVDGVRAYKSARQGVEVKIPSRKIRINNIEIIDYNFPFLKLEVSCSSGTYIRTLADDIGREYGIGGLVTELKRLSIDVFNLVNAVKLDDVSEKNIYEANEIMKDLPKINLTESQYQILANGNFIENEIFKEFKIEKPILGFFKEKLVGILELTDKGSKLKFKRKFNII